MSSNLNGKKSHKTGFIFDHDLYRNTAFIKTQKLSSFKKVIIKII